MMEQVTLFYEFGPFQINTAERLLLRDGCPVPLQPKAFDTLLALVENSGRVLGKDALLEKVWPDRFVEEGSLAQNVFMLRKALGEGQNGDQYIKTVPRRGYCFVATVKEWHDEGAVLIVEEHARSNVTLEGEQTTGYSRKLASFQTINTPPEPIIARKAAPADRLLSGKVLGTRAVPVPGKPGQGAIIGSLALMVIAAVAFALYKFVIQNQFTARPAPAFQAISMTRLTNTGKSIDAAISPDGKYVVHVMATAGQQSLWVRQVAIASNAQVVPPAEARYQGLAFSRDGNWIYYVRDHALHQVPALGGASRQLLADVDSPITLSPDGNQLAFVREDLSQGESALIIANVDGGGERKLAARQLPDYFRSAAWSPDGKVIACSVGTRTSNRFMTVVAVAVGSGAESLTTAQRWSRAGRLAWLADGSGLLMTATDRIIGSSQIWHIAYPGGEARRITNDLNDYTGVSLTADAKTLVTVRNDRLSNIWTLPGGDASHARQITSGAGQDRHPSWTPDGRVVYQSRASGNPEIWVMGPDGKGQKQLTVDAGANFHPTVSSDGRYIVFVSTRAGAQSIWRMDIDGTNPKQLTGGSGDNFPHCLPDGKWIVYASESSGKTTLWKAPLDGGESVQVTDRLSRLPAASPDGKLVACYYWDERPGSPLRLAVIPLAGGQPIKMFDLPPTADFWAAVRWTPDGRALTYVDNRNGISNIWSQPLDGSPPRQLTNFSADRIFYFDWSRDGKQLACSRGVVTDDVVIVADSK